jgi:hypothetical protein
MISMETFLHYRKFSLSLTHNIKRNTGLLLILGFLCLQSGQAKSQGCSQCSIPSFPALTVYQSFQTNHGIGFGVEAGTWNKEASKFSYFIGTSMVWTDIASDSKTSTAQKQAMLSFYLKGQYRLSSHLYFVAAPGITNLSFLELQTGLRYVVPLTRIIGIGVEPAYAFSQKQFLINANLHFALR